MNQPEVLHRTVFRIFEPSEKLWGQLFGQLPPEKQDIFYSPDYAELTARYLHKIGRPFCAALTRDDHIILYPFLQRPLQTLLADTGISVKGYDLHGLYGRNGLVSNTEDPDLLAHFHTQFNHYCRENNVLCGFDRFHPIMENHRWAAPGTTVIDIGGFIVADLTKPIDVLERQFKHAVRKNINKALRAGVTVFSESDASHLDQFLAIYTHTMQRHEARAFYYVGPEYYRALADRLPSGIRFFYAKLGESIISCELVLIQGLYCHSFLGGTLSAYLDQCPNHLLKREIIRCARDLGCRYYLLGGGETAHNSVWTYKLGFAPDGNRPSFVGGTIYDEAAYQRLRERLTQQGISFPGDRFQFYDRH